MNTYQPLPISTSGNGIDRCGNVAQYAAPNVVYARACWQSWPIPTQRWGSWQPWGGVPPSGGSACGCGGSAMSSLFAGGAALAAWMIAARLPPASALRQSDEPMPHCRAGVEAAGRRSLGRLPSLRLRRHRRSQRRACSLRPRPSASRPWPWPVPFHRRSRPASCRRSNRHRRPCRNGRGRRD